MTKVIPIINNTDTEQRIANSNLKIPPISSNNFTILESAKGSMILAVNEYIILNIPNFIIGITQIPIITITPTTPTAFFKITPQPNILSTPSPKIFPYDRY